MTMAEKKLMSIQKELEKLNKSLERYKGIHEKKQGLCEKLDCDWSREQMIEHRENGTMSDKQWIAWFDRQISEGNVEDTESRIENALKRLARAEEEWAKVQGSIEEQEEITAKEEAWLKSFEKSEDDYYKWLAEFKADCLKDGIIIEDATGNYIRGFSRSGRKFSMYINDGWTERSLHSYTLRIEENTVFTSGLFSTGYRYLMK